MTEPGTADTLPPVATYAARGARGFFFPDVHRRATAHLDEHSTKQPGEIMYELGPPMSRFSGTAEGAELFARSLADATGLANTLLSEFPYLDRLPCLRPCCVWSLAPTFGDDGNVSNLAKVAFDLDAVKNRDNAYITDRPFLVFDAAAIAAKLFEFCASHMDTRPSFDNERVYVFYGEFADKPRSAHVVFPEMVWSVSTRFMSKGDPVFDELNVFLLQYGLEVDTSIYRSGLKVPLSDKWLAASKQWRGAAQIPVAFPRGATIADMFVDCSLLVPIDNTYRFVHLPPRVAAAANVGAGVRQLQQQVIVLPAAAVDVVGTGSNSAPWLSRLFSAVPQWCDDGVRVLQSRWQGTSTELVASVGRFCPIAKREHSKSKSYALVNGTDLSITVRCHSGGCGTSLVFPGPERAEAMTEQERVLRDLNERYALGPETATSNRRTYVIWDLSNPRAVYHMTAQAFALLLKPVKIRFMVRPAYGNDPAVYKNRPASEVWLEWKERRQIEGCVCEPDGAAPGFFNTYPGFVAMYEELRASMPPGLENLELKFPCWLRHLRVNVCNNEPLAYEYVLNWFSFLLQHMGKKPRVALLLSGRQGHGKNSLMAPFQLLLGSLSVQVSDSRQIGAHFNDYLRNIRLVIFDEAHAVDRTGMGVVKALITEPRMQMEAKFEARTEHKSWHAVVFLSNHMSAYTADGSERRIFALDVTYRMEEDKTAWFDQLVRERNNPECVAAMLQYFLKRDVSNWNPDHRPYSPALWRQKYTSLPAVVKLWFRVLVNGEFDMSSVPTGSRGRSHQLVLPDMAQTPAEGADEGPDAVEGRIWTTDLAGGMIPLPQLQTMFEKSLAKADRKCQSDYVAVCQTGLSVQTGSIKIDQRASSVIFKNPGAGRSRFKALLLPQLRVCREGFAAFYGEPVEIFASVPQGDL